MTNDLNSSAFGAPLNTAAEQRESGNLRLWDRVELAGNAEFMRDSAVCRPSTPLRSTQSQTARWVRLATDLTEEDMVKLFITGGLTHLDYAVKDLKTSGIVCQVDRPHRGDTRRYQLGVPKERLSEVVETLSRYGVTFAQN